MIKKYLSMMSMVILASCNSTGAESINDELHDYRNDWQELQSMMDEFYDQLDESQRNVRYPELEAFYEEELLPQLDEMANYAEDIEPNHEEIRELHGIQEEAIEKLEMSMKITYELVNDEDSDNSIDNSVQAGEYMAEAEDLQLRFNEQWDALFDEYNEDDEVK
ncbi:hypothetical protein HUG15_19725 [Salicibibacter cibarius]|uniref:Uncharacterized protein n=1 Tax=Salicibibacter cibarius TaxID=2743000 RepID=A0A7T6Z745_9BACI|nr:hypothetical protein [Salicibibacter cibarius]QQK77591.1 hypothetical protein HUG15_19725 [Salicibibacter cibarius]